MPHAIIEYSENLQTAVMSVEISKLVHGVMIKSGLFSTADIKTRSYVAQDFLVGEKGSHGSFAHVTVYLLEGRTILQKQMLSEAIRDLLHVHLPAADQLSVDIQDMQKDTYRKHVGP